MAAPDSRAIRQRLESLAAAGVEQLPRRGGTAVVAAPLPATAAPAAVVAPDVQERLRHLAVLDRQVAACTACAELAATRQTTVFGSGRPDARLCFLGEAPGADEDATGQPFVGRAGQLLTKIIEACMLTRDEVYILNVLKCRPPGNRAPATDEVANCRGFFERQFELIDPEFICCLGTSAAHALLGTTEPIGRLRGRWFKHGRAEVLCTYHPSYLLRNPAAKRDVWEDMKLLMARMGLKP